MTDPNFLLPRGVYRAPVLGPNRETLIYAVDHSHCLLRDPQWVLIPVGDNPFAAMEYLWERLDELDPVPDTPQSLPAVG
jgi:hypothetical protein